MSTRLDEARARVGALLLAQDVDVDPDPDGTWVVRCGSTVLAVSVFEDGTHTYVRIASLLLAGIRLQLDVVARLLRLNAEVLVGAFQVFEDETVAFTHTLLADALDAAAFAHALAYVARVGDDHDEELQALAGGARCEDVIDGAWRP